MPERRVAVVTDSTSTLTHDEAAAHGIVVIPLQVIIGATSYDEGVDEGASPEMVAAALKSFTPVTTSRPSPAGMLEVYADLAAQGYDEIVTFHLSSRMSGTFESALMASRDATIPVHVVDTQQVGPAVGYAAIAAVRALEGGASAEKAGKIGLERALSSTSLFYVDTLEYLRRGGRVGSAAAFFGGALAVKPLLRIENGSIESFEKVRTAGKALARLEDLAAEAAGEDPVELTVAHLASPDRAEQLANKLAARLGLQAPVRTVELGAVLGAHVGPGMVAVCVMPTGA
ncbi:MULTISPECIES: DegV family protein [unclassified Nocardioides]|uniref:DegV family protein n=1 Tax=unclassified Nocardioides TaxID=2615069 RepID=UPI0006FFBCDD|nr:MULTISPECIES: DegV family protein [unclassified Nocardioides]KQY54570.1 fatty acid-binding protein DegV [Nocardioides sp. Root140]KQZ66445.1 fatty acid-binding protein DegV [Nocardioides sp. Root151]KRF19645.1 fatty acid-binding protein DegV [Nocardioides sp. Soil796]